MATKPKISKVSKMTPIERQLSIQFLKKDENWKLFFSKRKKIGQDYFYYRNEKFYIEEFIEMDNENEIND